MSKHVSVMASEALRLLDVREDGVYVDGTLGRGGHSKLILEKLKGGKLNLANFKATFRSIGGTAGSIQNSPTNAYEVASLDNDTSSTLDLSAFSLSVTGRWDVAVSDLSAGRHPFYTAAVSFGEGATVAVDDLAALEEAGVSKVALLETSAAFTGVPAIEGNNGRWSLSAKGCTLWLCLQRGLTVYVK